MNVINEFKYQNQDCVKHKNLFIAGLLLKLFAWVGVKGRNNLPFIKTFSHQQLSFLDTGLNAFTVKTWLHVIFLVMISRL